MGMNLQAVIAANREQQTRARQLNARSGQKLFQVLTQHEWEVWVSKNLLGASSAKEVPNPELLKLPALDQSLVEVVVRESPDFITLLGRQVAVEYREGLPPKITLKLGPGDDFWQLLPDNGVRIGSRLAEITIGFGWYQSISGTYIPNLKVQMREHLNQKQWENWPRPLISLPDLQSEQASIPPIITAQYGKCVTEGTPLVAYGVVTVRAFYSGFGEPGLEGKWHQSQSEAMAEQATSVSKLPEVLARVRIKRETAKARDEAQAAQAKAGDLYSRFSQDLDSDLRARLYEFRYAMLPLFADQLRQWTSKTNAVLAQAEASIQNRRTGGRGLVQGGPVHAPARSFTSVGNRWFKCDQGHTERVDKATWTKYEQGEAITITCAICHQKAEVKRT